MGHWAPPSFHNHLWGHFHENEQSPEVMGSINHQHTLISHVHSLPLLLCLRLCLSLLLSLSLACSRSYKILNLSELWQLIRTSQKHSKLKLRLLYLTQRTSEKACSPVGAMKRVETPPSGRTALVFPTPQWPLLQGLAPPLLPVRVEKPGLWLSHLCLWPLLGPPCMGNRVQWLRG